MNKADINRISRILAIQALYAYVIGDRARKDLSKILNEIKEEFILINGLEEEVPKIDIKFALSLLEYTLAENDALEQEISLHLATNWRFERLPLTMQIILKIAISELLHLNTPPQVALDEYTTIASGFFNDKETGFVNSILQKIASKIKG